MWDLKSKTMSNSTKLKQQGQALAAFFYLLLTTFSVDCYSRVIVSKLDTSFLNSKYWVTSGVSTDQFSDCWFMNGKNSFVEMLEPINLSQIDNLHVECGLATRGSIQELSVLFEISDDGLNWNIIKQIKIANKVTSQKSYDFDLFNLNLSYKHPKIRLRTSSGDTDTGIKLFNLTVSGVPKPLFNPKLSEVTDITTSSFIAHWGRQENVSNYEFSLYKKAQGTENKVVFLENFDAINISTTDKLDPVVNSLLPGWSAKNVFCYPALDNSGSYLKIGTAKLDGNIFLPTLDLSANKGTFKLSFKLGNNGETSRVCIWINGEKKVINQENTQMRELDSYSFTLYNGTPTTSIVFCVNPDSGNTFILDDVSIEQIQPLVSQMIEGYPVTLNNQDSYLVKDLSPSTTYYYSVHPYNKYINAYRISSSQVKTLESEQLIVDSGEFKELSGQDINGNFQICQGGQAKGKVKINGEISYVCQLKPNMWHSFSIPFAPSKVGGYISGKPYMLRNGYDYILQQYNDGRFQKADLDKGGFIIKVLTLLDDNKLLFFSEKGVVLNDDSEISSLSLGYSHLVNPYAHSISPTSIVDADVYYIFKEGSFIPSYDDVLPFESFIAYRGPKGGYKRSITIDSKQVSVDKSILSDELVTIQGGYLHLSSFDSPVMVFSASGKLVYSCMGNTVCDIPLSNGLYLVKVNNKTYKVSINN